MAADGGCCSLMQGTHLKATAGTLEGENLWGLAWQFCSALVPSTFASSLPLLARNKHLRQEVGIEGRNGDYKAADCGAQDDLPVPPCVLPGCQ